MLAGGGLEEEGATNAAECDMLTYMTVADF